MAQAKKGMTDSYVKDGGIITRYRVIEEPVKEQQLLDEKARLEARLAEIDAILGA